jgi:hypothetical protein
MRSHAGWTTTRTADLARPRQRPGRAPSALDAQLQRDAEVSHFEYQVMAGLSESPGRTLRMSVLATLSEGSLPCISQVVSRLESAAG